MIDLDHTKTQMLEEISAPRDLAGLDLTSPADPAFASNDVVLLRERGRTPDDLLESLNAAIAARFADEAPERLEPDLILPLKKAVGNAYKWGNRKDPERHVTVEIVVTRTGALLSISNEGQGFDAAAVFARFAREEQFYTHGGSGFTHFQRARSLVSYADAGRTLLIRFLCDQDVGQAPTEAQRSALGTAADAATMTRILSARLPQFQSGRRTLRSCRVYVPGEQDSEHPEVRYVVMSQDRASGRTRKTTLTGRLLPPRAARAEFTVARQLARVRALRNGVLRAPRPVAVLESPSLVLFKCKPSGDLRDHLKKQSDPRLVSAVLEKIARGLRAVHESPMDPGRSEDISEALDRSRAAALDAAGVLQDNGCAGRLERLERLGSALRQRAERLEPCDPVPILGDLEWDRILRVEGKLTFWKFEPCRRSHPGLDLGGFLADLSRFYLAGKHQAPDVYRAGRQVVLESYFKEQAPAWRKDVPVLLASALVLRLDRLLRRPKKKWDRKVDGLLDQIEGALA